jgi:large subunit ribosomal protein L5
MIPRLKKCYMEEVLPKLMQMSEFKYKNKQQVPYIQKIVINRGLGDASQNEQILKSSLKIF